MADLDRDQEPSAVDEDDGGAPVLVREPQQDRSRRTLRRILDAGLHILEHEGSDALTVTGITKRARTSVGSFYARFDGKDDLLRYLGERSLNEAVEVWGQLTEGLQPGGGLRGSVSDVVQRLGWLYLEGAGRSVMLLDGVEDPPPTRRRRLEDQIARDIRELAIASPVRADLATRVLTGILQDAAARVVRADSNGGRVDSPYPDPPVLLSELVEVLVGYLGGEVREPSAAAETQIASLLETVDFSPPAPTEADRESEELVKVEPEPTAASDVDEVEEPPVVEAEPEAGSEPVEATRSEIDTDSLIELAVGAAAVEERTVVEDVPAEEDLTVEQEAAAAPPEPESTIEEPVVQVAARPEPEPELEPELTEVLRSTFEDPQDASATHEVEEPDEPKPEPQEEDDDADPFDVWG